MGKKMPNQAVKFPSNQDILNAPEINEENNCHHPNLGNNAKDHSKSINEAIDSKKTRENPQVEEQRKQTFINAFQTNPENQEGEPLENLGDATGELPKKSSGYVKFFRFYYDCNSKRHPKWTPNQITKIVSLLWKKNKAFKKVSVPSQAGNSRRSNKPLSGKEAFKVEHKDLPKKQIDELWAKLPQESKNFWKRKGESYGSTSTNSEEINSFKNQKISPKMVDIAKLLRTF